MKQSIFKGKETAVFLVVLVSFVALSVVGFFNLLFWLMGY